MKWWHITQNHFQCISLTIWISLKRMPIHVGVTYRHIRALYGVSKSFLINPCLSQRCQSNCKKSVVCVCPRKRAFLCPCPLCLDSWRTLPSTVECRVTSGKSPLILLMKGCLRAVPDMNQRHTASYKSRAFGGKYNTWRDWTITKVKVNHVVM